MIKFWPWKSVGYKIVIPLEENMVVKKQDVNEAAQKSREVLPSEAQEIAKQATASASHIVGALRHRRADLQLEMKKLEEERQRLEWASADLSAQIDWWSRHWEAEGHLVQAMGVEGVQDFLYATLTEKAADGQKEE